MHCSQLTIFRQATLTYAAMKVTQEQASRFVPPTCVAKPGLLFDSYPEGEFS